MKLSCAETAKYPDGSIGYCAINSLYSVNPYRCGSLNIQIAVELSLRKKLAGRIRLFSTSGSGQFYFKVGFSPECNTKYEILLNGKNIDGDAMYLPVHSINIWKKKIAKKPVILSEAEVKEYCAVDEIKPKLTGRRPSF